MEEATHIDSVESKRNRKRFFLCMLDRKAFRRQINTVMLKRCHSSIDPELKSSNVLSY